MHPPYLELYQNGILKQRVKEAYAMLEKCRVCPRECGVNRLKNEHGFCQSGLLPVVSSCNSHHGEEPPISGHHGSGTIFLTNCNLRCVFCQNYPISQLGVGNEITATELAKRMLKLQKMGCHNINFVTPTHFTPQILDAVESAIADGLNIPILWNTNGYESIETLRLLDGIISIYLPDAKYIDPQMAQKYSNAPLNYPEINLKAIKEMWRQAGSLIVDEKGIAQKGMIIRHLVLPEKIAGTKQVLKMLAQEISKDVYISLMSQYFPANKASSYPEINRKISRQEYDDALNCLDDEGLHEGWIQPY
ncbi:radical SAM protein [Candidatus Desantisbacteria bacterium]|nr:radical SAM protein [Candidatus Desantisbacteria bacterium]